MAGGPPAGRPGAAFPVVPGLRRRLDRALVGPVNPRGYAAATLPNYRLEPDGRDVALIRFAADFSP